MSVYYDQDAQTQRIIAKEADGCIKKPFDMEEAINTVERIVCSSGTKGPYKK